MYCYDATKGKPEGDLNPTQQEPFENMDTLFKAALLSVLDDSIMDSYMSFGSSKDMWAALEATFGASSAGNELYVMEQFCDYKMTDERSVVQQIMRYSQALRNLSTLSVCCQTNLLLGTSLPSFHLHGTILLLL